MRLTVRTNIAMRALMTCAVNPDRIVRKAEIAGVAGASEAHLGVVINQLAQTGFIETIRGRHGGIRQLQDGERRPFRVARPLQRYGPGPAVGAPSDLRLAPRDLLGAPRRPGRKVVQCGDDALDARLEHVVDRNKVPGTEPPPRLSHVSPFVALHRQAHR